MGYVYVRAHKRRRPRKSKQSSSNSWLFRSIGIGIPVFALLYFLSRIPAQIYFAIATTIVAFIVCGFLLFISIVIYQHQHQIKLDIENRDSQEYMQQVNFQTQKSPQQQTAPHQNDVQQVQDQVQAQQERERLAQIKTRNDMLGPHSAVKKTAFWH